MCGSWAGNEFAHLVKPARIREAPAGVIPHAAHDFGVLFESLIALTGRLSDRASPGLHPFNIAARAQPVAVGGEREAVPVGDGPVTDPTVAASNAADLARR